MNTIPFGQRRGGGFGFAPTVLHLHDRPDALAWATFALVLLLVLTVGAMIVARLAARRSRRWRGPRHFAFAAGPGHHDPLDVLRWRYARGEISRDDFLQGASDLTAQGGSPPAPPQPE